MPPDPDGIRDMITCLFFLMDFLVHKRVVFCSHAIFSGNWHLPISNKPALSLSRGYPKKYNNFSRFSSDSHHPRPCQQDHWVDPFDECVSIFQVDIVFCPVSLHLFFYPCGLALSELCSGLESKKKPGESTGEREGSPLVALDSRSVIHSLLHSFISKNRKLMSCSCTKKRASFTRRLSSQRFIIYFKLKALGYVRVCVYVCAVNNISIVIRTFSKSLSLSRPLLFWRSF